MLSKLTFFFKPQQPLPNNFSLSILGNIVELGMWADFSKHPLDRESATSDYYLSRHSISLSSFITFQYKLVIIENSNIVHWENLPFNTNRSYTIKETSITLQGCEGDLMIQEVAFLPPMLESESALLRRNKPNHKKQKRLVEDSTYSMDITFEGTEETVKEKLNSSSSLATLGKKTLKRSRSNLVKKDKHLSEKIARRAFIRKRNRDSHSISDASLSSHVISSQSSRKDLNSMAGPLLSHEAEEEKTLKRLDLQQLYWKMMEKTPNRLGGFSILKSQNDIVYHVSDDYIINLNHEEVVYTVMGYLPFLVEFDRKDNKWNVSFNPPSVQILKYGSHFFSQARNQYKKMVWVGMLFDEIPQSQQSALKELLLENYRCLVVFPKPEVHLNYIMYCYEYLDPILSNSFNQANRSFEMLEKFAAAYEDFRAINEMFADVIAEHSKDNPPIFVIDYHLLLVNFYFSKKIVKPAIVFYYGTTFPCFENFQLLHFSEELLSSMLLGNIICFDEFACARQFLSIISMIMGLKYEARRGDLIVRYMGRQIKIKINSMGIDSTYLEAIKHSNDFLSQCSEICKTYDSKKLLLSIDPLDKLSLIDVKLRQYSKFLSENSHLRSSLLLVQIISPTFWDLEMLITGSSYQRTSQYLASLRTLAEEIGPSVLIIINLSPKYLKMKALLPLLEGFEVKEISVVEIYALMNMSKLFLKTAVRNDNCVDALEFLYLNESGGQALFSDFLTVNPLFLKVNKFNPFSYEDFSAKFNAFLNPTSQVMEENIMPFIETNLTLLKKHTIISWLEALLYDLKKSILFAKHANLTKVEKMTSYHSVTYFKLATNEFFKYLNIKETIKNYKNSYNRIIFLDYEGTLVDSKQFCSPSEVKDHLGNTVITLKPSEAILESLKLLCNDPRNSVYLITGKSPRDLGPWIVDIRNLNIFCEYGYLIRLKRGGNEWIRLFEFNDRWKEKGKKIMQGFLKNTQGSSITEKESGIVWNHGEVPEDFGWKQAELLEKQLKNELINVKEIDIVRGRYYVEIRPYGVNKGTATELILQKASQEKGKIDFLMAIGQGISDEEVFASVKRNIDDVHDLWDEKRFFHYLCCVGKKPSNAEYYLDNVEDVEKFMNQIVSLYRMHKKDSL